MPKSTAAQPLAAPTCLTAPQRLCTVRAMILKNGRLEQRGVNLSLAIQPSDDTRKRCIGVRKASVWPPSGGVRCVHARPRTSALTCMVLRKLWKPIYIYRKTLGQWARFARGPTQLRAHILTQTVAVGAPRGQAKQHIMRVGKPRMQIRTRPCDQDALQLARECVRTSHTNLANDGAAGLVGAEPRQEFQQ